MGLGCLWGWSKEEGNWSVRNFFMAGKIDIRGLFPHRTSYLEQTQNGFFRGLYVKVARFLCDSQKKKEIGQIRLLFMAREIDPKFSFHTGDPGGKRSPQGSTFPHRASHSEIDP